MRQKNILFLLVAFIAGAFFPASASAVQSTQAPADKTASQQNAQTQQQAASQPSPQANQSALQVICIFGANGDCTKDGVSETLGDHLRLKVADLNGWLKTNSNSAQNLSLFLNGRQVSKSPRAVLPDKNELIFDLVRITGSADIHTATLASAWDDLIEREQNPEKWLTHGVTRRVHPSVGVDGGVTTSSDSVFILVLLSAPWVYVCLVFWLGILLALILLGSKSGMLRDNPGGPFSLARTQMAVWSWLLISGYFFLFVMFRDASIDIPASMLGLFGISASTYVGAVLVDRSTSSSSGKSRGFWMDICGPDQGIQLHRIQIIAWTVVLGFVFIVRVFTKLSIPDFNPTLLGLLGLSAGTYVGFKFPENQAPAVAPAPVAAPAPVQGAPAAPAAAARGAGGTP
jgi:hypothetical protein